MTDFVKEAFANRTPPKDKTNGAQSDLDKTVATQTQQKFGDDPEQVQQNEEAQQTNPNKIIADSTKDLAVAEISSDKGLRGFYGVEGIDATKKLPQAISTERGVRAFIKENEPISFSDQTKIKQDRESIDFENKKAGSAAGIDIDFAVPAGTAVGLLRLMGEEGRLDKLERFPVTQQQVLSILEVETAIQTMKAQDVDNNNPQLQNLVASYKIMIGQLIQSDLTSMDIDGEDSYSQELKRAYESYVSEMPKLIYTKSQDGSTLQTKYDQLVSKSDISTFRSVYYDLDTKKDRGFADKSSRNAKKQLLENPIWLEEISAMMQNSPAIAEVISRESDKEYISEFERKMIKELDNKIGPQMRAGYEKAVEMLGQDEANNQFRHVQDLFSVYDKISYKTIEDDLIQNAYAPVSSFNVIGEMFNAEEADADYEADVATRVKKLSAGKRAQQEAYNIVYGDGGGGAPSSSLISPGGNERIERFSSKVRT